MNGDRGGHRLADRILESPITWLITAVNLGVFTIAWMHGEHEGRNLSRETLLNYGALHWYFVWQGEYWRLMTAVFLHVGWIHLLWNVWVGFGWCADIERTVGSAWFTFAYITTGIGASAVSVICQPAFGAGASGAGFGMVAVTLAILFRREGSWSAFFSNAMVRRILVWTGIWVLLGYSFVSVRMDNYAHLGGFAFGIPAGLILESRRGKKRTLWMAGVAAYIFVWLGVVIVACIPGLGFGKRGV